MKDFPEAVVAQIVGEFRKAGWDVSSPRGVEDGDVVITITIKERSAPHAG